MTNRFRVATTLARRLEEIGVLPADVLRHAGLPAGLFDQEKILVSTEELFALYRGLGQAGRDPAIGLKLGTERYDPIAIADQVGGLLKPLLAGRRPGIEDVAVR